ncbi:MAG: hypothetical protein FWB95_06495 [Treponema sp.]|nr:hypothetical protein [Treponema sp.]
MKKIVIKTLFSMEAMQSIAIIALTAVIGFSFAACGEEDNGNGNGGGGNGIDFISVTANGSAAQTTTQLTLTFSKVIPPSSYDNSPFSAGNITLSGITGVGKGTLSGSGPTYTLNISGFSSGGALTVSVSSPNPYSVPINGSPKTVTIYHDGAGVMTWTTVNGSFGEVRAIAWGGTSGSEKFICNRGFYSADGITWTATTGTVGSLAIVWGADKFVTSGGNYSADGINWTAGTLPNTISQTVGIAYSGSRYIIGGATGEGGWATGGGIAYSSNGTSGWTVVKDSAFGSHTQGVSGRVDYICYGGGKFIAGGSDHDYKDFIAYSTNNGASWTKVTNNPLSYGVNDFAYGGGKFVAVSAAGGIAYSSDGINWTKAANSTFGSSSIEGVAYGGNRFVAVGRDGKIAYSFDGITWTAVANTTFSSTSNIYGIAYGNGKFVAGSYDGKIAYSSVN